MVVLLGLFFFFLLVAEEVWMNGMHWFLTRDVTKKMSKGSAKKYVDYSNSSHRSFIPIILIALSLFWVAIFAGIFFTVIKIVLKTYSCIKPIIYSNIQKLSFVIAFVPEFFYQLLKSFHGHFTIHFVPIFLLKQQHFMY